MSKIPDFTDSRIRTVESSLKKRYPEPPAGLQQVDTEIRLALHDRELTRVPGRYWQAENGCNFIIVKSGKSRYRGRFTYCVRRRYGTGIEEYDDHADCVISLPRTQADQALQEQEEAVREAGQ